MNDVYPGTLDQKPMREDNPELEEGFQVVTMYEKLRHKCKSPDERKVLLVGLVSKACIQYALKEQEAVIALKMAKKGIPEKVPNEALIRARNSRK